MIIDLVNKLMKPIIIIALISFITTWAFNIQNVLISEQVINGFTIKTVDLREYLNNITNAWATNALNFEDVIPPGNFEQVQGSVIDSSFWNALFNNIAYVIQWIYFPINFILWIDRWISWLLKIALALIGWNTAINPTTNDYYSSLVEILEWVTQNLKIPYILSN